MCEKFGKILIILDRAPQHGAKSVLDAIKELDDMIKMAFLPQGCPDLNVRGALISDEDECTV